MRPRLRRWLLGLSLGTLAIGALTCGTWSVIRARAGEPTAAMGDTWHEGHRVLDRRGRLLRELTSDLGLRGQPRELDDIGPRLLAATLVSEDKTFFDHDGLDPQAIARALLQSVRHGRLVSGASTITQQLVKMLDARGQARARGLMDKLFEVARAQNLEELIGKDEILLAYLNRLPYGHGLTGPETAARNYFGVAPRDLSWAQAAFLAVLPRAPSYLDPYAHPERVLLRQQALLGALRDAGELTDLEHTRAVAEPIELRPLTRPFFAPHLVDALRLEGRLSPGTATTTTLDLDLQRDIEGAVRVHLAAIADRGASDAAVLVVDNDTGDVLAYVGSADFHSDEISGQVDMVRARRQPGSTLKPFVYGLAFAAGHHGPELTADVPTTFQEAGGGSYTPENFDRGFEGPIPLREALAGSLNIPAVRLAAELGPAAVLRALRDLGLRSLDRDADHYGLALALGSGEVELRELAAAYVALARGGESIALRFTTTDPSATPARVFTPEVAALVTEALADPLARARPPRPRPVRARLPRRGQDRHLLRLSRHLDRRLHPRAHRRGVARQRRRLPDRAPHRRLRCRPAVRRRHAPRHGRRPPAPPAVGARAARRRRGLPAVRRPGRPRLRRTRPPQVLQRTCPEGHLRLPRPRAPRSQRPRRPALRPAGLRHRRRVPARVRRVAGLQDDRR
ncbi:transglycosylase domain-containing protein [Nannocystis pusilla]|uniref:peptidoglycan glycosyltransferase n=1 Tax=Nannocystis pusilla TaxID=889268 RepID=A0A9X3IZW8_9BACT|nr:transglycosylase domain-containing protein [Nannocystis pusilla]MCY1011052.1 transglycosylase domain-containing protein [Nannocystis pusilla]